jgi:hypothetical protein
MIVYGTANTINAPVITPPIDDSIGVDVSDWKHVLRNVHPISPGIAATYTTYPNWYVKVRPWRWYSYASQGSGYPTGQWFSGVEMSVDLSGDPGTSMPMTTLYPTWGCEKMYFQVIESNNGPLAVDWTIGVGVYGIERRDNQYTSEAYTGADNSQAGGGGGTLIDTYCDIVTATGAAAIAAVTPNWGTDFELVAVTCHLSAVPVAVGENFRVYLDAGAGAAYDTTLFIVDPTAALGGLTDIVFTPKTRLLFNANDLIRVTWANSGARTYGLRIVIRSAVST